MRQDLQAIVGRILWYTYCQCVSGTAAPIGTSPAQPSGQITDNPTGLSIGSCPTNTCAESQVFESLAFGAGGTITWDILPGTGISNAASKWLCFVTSDGLIGGNPFYPVVNTLSFLSSTNAVLSTFVWTQTQDTSHIGPKFFQVTIPTGANHISLTSHTEVASPGTMTMTALFHWFCTAPPTSINQECCAPDPILTNMIIQVLQNEQFIVNLLQNLNVGGLKNYSKGTVHTALTGSQSIPVHQLAGVLVQITARPPTNIQPGNPPYIWDMGWMSILTGDGMIEERRLTRDQQLWFPALMSLAVTFGLFLNAGVTATITELIPA